MTRFLLPILLLFSLSACDYNAEPLPNHIAADYEIAFPIADTTVAIIDFFQLSSAPSSHVIIPKGTAVSITISYPFYLADFASNNYAVYWIEPKAIIGNHFPEIVQINLSCYINSLSDSQYILANRLNLPAGENTLFTDDHISNTDFPIAEANKLYIIVELYAKEDTSIQELLEAELKINFGLKAALRINHAT